MWRYEYCLRLTDRLGQGKRHRRMWATVRLRTLSWRAADSLRHRGNAMWFTWSWRRSACAPVGTSGVAPAARYGAESTCDGAVAARLASCRLTSAKASLWRLSVGQDVSVRHYTWRS